MCVGVGVGVRVGVGVWVCVCACACSTCAIMYFASSLCGLCDLIKCCCGMQRIRGLLGIEAGPFRCGGKMSSVVNKAGSRAAYSIGCVYAHLTAVRVTSEILTTFRFSFWL